MMFRIVCLALAFSVALERSGANTRSAAPSEAVAREAETYAQRVETELRENILPFWLEHARDRERGGFFGEIDGEGRIKPDAPRGALLTARVLWTFSAAYRHYGDPEYREMARWAYEDLWARFRDPAHGGLYWRTQADGTPLDPGKMIYVQAFGLYGLSEYFRATGEQAALDRAIEIYRLIEFHSHDRTHRGYLEEFSQDWQVSRERGRRRSPMGSQDQKSQNVHLHILEAYTSLLRVWPDPQLKQNLRELIDVMQTHVLDSNTHHLRLFLAEDWTPRSDTISFGHDIEYSWLVTEAAEVLGDDGMLEAIKAEAVRIAAVTLAQGVDPDGGVLTEADPHGFTDTYKEWWAQAEATVGFLNAYQLSQDPKYFDASLRSWRFIEQHLVDRDGGEWFHGVSRDAKNKSTLKVSFWKCPYHNGRACMELIERLRAIRATP